MASPRCESPVACSESTVDSFADIEDGSYFSGDSTGLAQRCAFVARNFCRPSPVIVKNTFIDGFESDEDDECSEVAMRATKSLPAHRYSADPTSPVGLPCQAQRVVPSVQFCAYKPQQDEPLPKLQQPQPPHERVPPPPPAERPLLGVWAKMRAQEEWEQRPPASPPHSGPAADEGADSVEDRLPEISLGSEAHSTGECKPCAWFWRPQGCSNGYECRHCHLCPAGEVKNRRRHKLAGLRKGKAPSPSTSTPTAVTQEPTKPRPR